MSMSLSEIQQAIEALSPDEQATLTKWIADRDNELWDLEMDVFSPGGAGIELLEEAKAQAQRGESTPRALGRPRG